MLWPPKQQGIAARKESFERVQGCRPIGCGRLGPVQSYARGRSISRTMHSSESALCATSHSALSVTTHSAQNAKRKMPRKFGAGDFCDGRLETADWETCANFENAIKTVHHQANVQLAVDSTNRRSDTAPVQKRDPAEPGPTRPRVPLSSRRRWNEPVGLRPLLLPRCIPRLRLRGHSLGLLPHLRQGRAVHRRRSRRR